MSSQFKLTRRALLAGLSAIAVVVGRDRRLRLSDTKDEKIAFACNGTQLFEYHYAKSLPKPYIHPLYAPNRTVLTLDSPPDHKHHRGLMLAWSNVNGADFWGEPKSTRGPHGFTVHQKFERIRERSGELTAIDHWVADGRILLVERRTLRAYPPDADTLALDWESELKAAGTEVTLKAHALGFDGLGVRFIHNSTQTLPFPSKLFFPVAMPVSYGFLTRDSHRQRNTFMTSAAKAASKYELAAPFWLRFAKRSKPPDTATPPHRRKQCRERQRPEAENGHDCPVRAVRPSAKNEINR